MKSDSAYQLTAAVLATADTFLRESQRLFRPHGLTAAQYNVLNVLAEHPDGLSQRALSDFLVVDRSNVTGLLDRMEKAGWVQRRDHPEDRRVYQVSLTAAGKKLLAKVQPLYFQVVEQVTRGVSAKRMREGVDLLRELSEAAVRWELPAK